MSQLDKYTVEVRGVLASAREEARRLRHRLVGTEHLLLGLLKLKAPLIEALFVSLQTSSQCVAQAVELLVEYSNKALLGRTSLNASARATMVRAEQEAGSVDAKLVSIEHVFLAICDERDGLVVSVLEKFGIFPDVVRRLLVVLLNDGREKILSIAEYQARYDATPTLNQCSRDLTMAALNEMLDPLIGREAELERTMQILSRRAKNNPVLIGPSGAGKTAIAEGLAQRIVQGRVPDNLRFCRMVVLDISMLTIDIGFRGDLEERLKCILQEIASVPEIILVLDELHSGVAEESIAVSHLFKALLAHGEFQFIGITTPNEYRKIIRADLALRRHFQPVWVTETSPQETLEILYALRSHYENFHQVNISDEALAAAVQMSSRYIPQRVQPDKAIDLIDEAASWVRVQRSVAPARVHQLRDAILVVEREKDAAIARHDFVRARCLLKRERQMHQMLWQMESDWKTNQQQKRPLLEEQDIAMIVARWTGIPIVQPVCEDAQRLLKIEDELHQRVIGQHEAVQAVAKAVRRSQTRMRDSRRPIGSFVFVGPTGVGKTELARALATTLFGDENALLKLEMSEFMDSQYVSRLIGAPVGYIGYEQAGQLTEAIRRRPYSIVLFDEIEKAHPKILDLLLQILEDGCLTDTHGQTVDFRNTIIIITANVGTIPLSHGFLSGQSSKQESLSDANEHMHDQIIPALKDLFKPELLNRIDEVILFHALEQKHLRKIVDLMVERMEKLLAKQSIKLQVTATACFTLTEQCCDPEYGARLLRRNVQRLLEDMLAELVLQGEIVAGDVVMVDAIDGKLATKVSSLGSSVGPVDDRKQAVA